MPGYDPVLGAPTPDTPNSGRLKWNAQHQEAFERLDDLEAASSITDHGQLSGLADDDHAQYYNQARGDARYSPLGHNHDDRYYTETEANTLLAAKASTASVDGVQSNLQAHINDTVDAHDASAISFVPTGTIASTTVQNAIAEVANEGGSGGGTSFSYARLVAFGAHT